MRVVAGMPKRIVVAKGAGECERFAAEELQRYLRRMTGRVLGIRCGRATGSGEIRIRARRGEERPRLPLGEGDDAFEINVTGKAVELRGGTPRAALYAVYAFLEELGCRWIAPAYSFYRGIGHEIVPRVSVWAPRPGRRESRPTFLYRRMPAAEPDSGFFPATKRQEREGLANTKALIDWMAKNRLNGLDCAMDPEGRCAPEKRSGGFAWDAIRGQLTPELRKRGMLIGVGGHCWHEFLHPKEFFDEHPEWFGVVDGERSRSYKTIFNTANPAAMRKFTSRVIEYLTAHPEIDFFLCWPPDGPRWSEDERSLAQGSPARRQGIVVKAIRDAIRREGLPVMVQCEIYATTAECPADNPYPSDVLVDTWVCRHQRQEPIYDPSIAWSRESLAPLQEWSQKHRGLLGAGIYLWWAGMMSIPVQRLGFLWSEMSYYRDRGAKSVTSCAIPDHCLALELPYYLYGRFAYDTSADVNALVRDYCSARFGSAAAIMEEYFWTLEKLTLRSLEKKEQPLVGAPVGRHMVAQGGAWASRCRNLLRRTRRMLRKRTRAMELLKRLGVALRYTELMLECQDLSRTGQRKRIADVVRRTMKLARRHRSDGLFVGVGSHRLNEELLRTHYCTVSRGPDEVNMRDLFVPHPEGE